MRPYAHHQFIEDTSGLLDRSTLEAVLPHAIIHAATTDMALGRKRGDAGTAGHEVFDALRGPMEQGAARSYEEESKD